MSVRIRRRVLFLLIAAAAGACAGPGEPTSTVPSVPVVPVTEAAPFLISNAVSGSAAAVLGSASSSLVDERVYVAAPPRTFPGAAMVRVRVDRTGATVAGDLIDGGFDPVSVSARTGDTLTVLLVGAAGSSTAYRITVPGNRPPIIVRTVPPQNKRDVPLNAHMLVVFSEPIDARTLTSQSVSVRAGSVIVPGTLAFTTPDQTTVEFVPRGDLESSTAYELVITENITDLDGTVLAAPRRVPFTTEAAPCAPPECPNGRLAFVRDGDIYTAFADGSNPIRLTQGIEPAWSADGRIAFTGAGGVYVMNEDGSHIRLVAPGGSTPAWSPDARRLAVVTPTVDANGIGLLTIEVVTLDTPMASPIRIGFDRGWNAWPTWSPDGSRVAFVSDWPAFDFASDVFVVDREGQHRDQLTHGFFGSVDIWPDYVLYAQPAWSPDGTKMALLKCPAYRSCEASSIVVANADGSKMFRLSETRGYVRPSWSPNGKWITFDGPTGIRYISADGWQLGTLIPNASSATWRP